MKSTQIAISSSYRLLFHVSVIVILSVGISIIFPMFFRSDDVLLMHWGSRHNLYQIFNINEERLGGLYRPIYHYFFSAGYNIFGLKPFGYQAVGTAIFLLQFYLLHYLCRIYFDPSSATAIIIAYCALFYNNFQMAFWFTDICFSMHIVFALLAIIFYLKSKVNLSYLSISYLFALLGALTKEPSILIVSAFILGDLMIHTPRNDYTRKLCVLLPYIAIAVWIILISGVMDARFKYSTDVTTLLDRLDYRFRYYFNFLLSGTKIVIPIILSISFAISISKSSLARVIAVLLAAPCYFSQYYYIIFLFSISGWFVIQQWKLLPFFLWMMLTSLTLPFMTFITPTYLFEFSFGFSVLIGYITNNYLIKNINFQFIANREKKLAASVVVIVIGALIAVNPAFNQVEALRLVVENRKNLAEGIDFIERSKDDIDYVVVLDHENFDSPEKLSKWAVKSNKEKAKSDKVMSSDNITQYLSLLGINHITVTSYSNYIKNPVVGPKVVLLLQNDADIEFSNDKRLTGKELFSYSHHGTNSLIVSSVR